VLASAVLALAGSTLAAGPASADPIGQVLEDGQAVASGPGLQASNVSFSGGVLHVSNPAGNPEDTITEIDGTLNSSSVSITSLSGTFDSCRWSGTPQSFQCPTGIGIGPGSDISLRFGFSQPYSQGLSSVNVIFDFGLPPACADAPSASTDQAALQLTTDDVNCNPPGATMLISATINAQRRTASFHFTASHATSYKCELVRDHRVMFRHACGTMKTYAGPLSAGSYIFVAWGMDAGGMSRAPAVKRFAIA
jgi:hypothetical protein